MTPSQSPTLNRNDTIVLLREVSNRASRWILDRIGLDGRPVGSDVANTWWRVPWALALAGHSHEASLVLSWVEREALDDEGDLRPGPYGGSTPMSPVYSLAHLTIASVLTQRWDTAQTIYRRILSRYRQPHGGIRLLRDASSDEQDWLFTAQLGLLSVMFNDDKVADETYRWFQRVWAAQPALDRLHLYTAWNQGALITNLDLSAFSPKFVDHTKPRQYYFQAGAAAAFLADHAARKRKTEPLELARAMLELNVRGTEAQYDDMESVHICKFAWGAAQMVHVDPVVNWTPHVLRMAAWFAERQNSDGSWDPSRFTLDREPTDLDKMWKTTEHLMEVEQMISALCAIPRRPGWITPASL